MLWAVIQSYIIYFVIPIALALAIGTRSVVSSVPVASPVIVGLIFCVFCVCSFVLFFEPFLCLALQDAPGPSFISLIPVLESAISQGPS